MRTIVITAAAMVCLITLIVVNAPPPDDPSSGVQWIPIARVFEVLKAENDAVRKLWTEEIVGAGQQRDLKFDKRWRDPQLEAGPLPALFLRETAESLRRSQVPLYLFLGSDFPINDANRFTGLQNAHFERIKENGEPQFFGDEEIGFETAMFSDVAVAEACVSCHNNEPEATKSHWKLGDIMGATTWSYPESSVGIEEALSMVRALRKGFRESFRQYLEKVATFSEPPAVGERWPAEGYFLPSTDVFIAEAERRTSARPLRAIIEFRRGGE